jgi:hypothetical protein
MSGATSPPPFALTACSGQQPLRLLFGTEKCEGDRMQVSDFNSNYTFITTGLPPDTAAFGSSCRGTRQLVLPSGAPFMLLAADRARIV